MPVNEQTDGMGPREREVMAMDFDGDGRDAALHLDEAREDDAAERLTGFDRGGAAPPVVVSAEVAADRGLDAAAAAEAKTPEPPLGMVTDAMGVDTRVERKDGLVLISLTCEETGLIASLTPDDAERVSNWLRTHARDARKFAAVEARANAAADKARAAVFKRNGLAK